MPFPWLALGIQVFSSILGASGKKKEAAHNQMVANFNADQLDADAMSVRNKSVQDDRDSRTKYASLKSSQRARLAARGVFVDSGTAEQIQDDTDFIRDIDSYRIRSTAEKSATTLETQADFNRESGEAIFKAGQSAATGDILAGAGNVAASWYRYQNPVG